MLTTRDHDQVASDAQSIQMFIHEMTMDVFGSSRARDPARRFADKSNGYESVRCLPDGTSRWQIELKPRSVCALTGLARALDRRVTE